MNRRSERAWFFRRQFQKTQWCCFFKLQGGCKHGSSCNFAHSAEEFSSQPDLKKTSLCKQWLEGTCLRTDGSCKFAHGDAEVRRMGALMGHRELANAVADEDVVEIKTMHGELDKMAVQNSKAQQNAQAATQDDKLDKNVLLQDSKRQTNMQLPVIADKLRIFPLLHEDDETSEGSSPWSPRASSDHTEFSRVSNCSYGQWSPDNSDTRS